ncbi:MAG: exo-alpha-sialidase, partial [Chthoniobacterales bacterium]
AARGADGNWSAPRAIFDRAAVGAAMDRYVLSLGNPLLLPESDGKLGLLFVSIAAGKWSGSSINYSVSNDRGETWSSPQKLTLNPLGNSAKVPECAFASGEVGLISSLKKKGCASAGIEGEESSKPGKASRAAFRESHQGARTTAKTTAASIKRRAAGHWLEVGRCVMR